MFEKHLWKSDILNKDAGHENVGKQRKSLLLILIQQGRSFPWVCVRMVIIVNCLLTEKKYISLKPM